MPAPVIKVIADSVADVPPQLAEQLDITVVPTVIHIGQESYLDDGVQISREEFYRLLPTLRELPTTSACPLGLSRAMIARKAEEADHLILITAPAHLSSIYNNFRIAAEEVASGRYTLVDSGQATKGEGFLVLAAAEAAASGASLDAVLSVVSDMKSRIHVFAALNTLENLRKSGRVGWAAAVAGTNLQIKPLVELSQGVVKSLANVRTFRRAMERLVQLGVEHAPLERLAILHTDFLEGAYELRQALSSVFPPEQALVVNANPALGVHVGARGLGIALVRQA